MKSYTPNKNDILNLLINSTAKNEIVDKCSLTVVSTIQNEIMSDKLLLFIKGIFEGYEEFIRDYFDELENNIVERENVIEDLELFIDKLM